MSVVQIKMEIHMSSKIKELVKVSSGWHTSYYFESMKDACQFVSTLGEKCMRFTPDGRGGVARLEKINWTIQYVSAMEPVWVTLAYEVQNYFDGSMEAWIAGGCIQEVPKGENASKAA